MIDVKDEGADGSGLKNGFRQEAELVQRVVATPSFVRSALLTSFLLYICDRKFQGRDKEITEYQIGVQALGRPDSYNPGEDNIVRNYARILRKRLEEYFAGSGRDEPMRIVIPRGHYVPIFEPNTPTPSEFSGEADLLESQHLELALGPARRTAKAAILHAMHRFRIPVALLLAACIAIAIYWAVRTRPARINDVFWKEVFDGTRATYLVPGDSGLAMMQEITGKEVHLSDYIAGDLDKEFHDFNLAAARGGTGYGFDRVSYFTSKADL
ncbi:MAG: hypothetical protein P4L10_17370, partial [Acidobacteriaceae bacterium]|nr:hypothetical protein [Acidobacteriaceae bacterium]